MARRDFVRRATLKALHEAQQVLISTTVAARRVETSLTSATPHAAPLSHGSSPECAIVITTFEKRQLTYCLPLVHSIRSGDDSTPIVVMINGNVDGQVNDSERRFFLRELSAFPQVYPVSLTRMVGLARLWNLGIQIAAAEVCLILNDDLLVQSRHFVADRVALAQGAAADLLTIGGGSWSHFAISRRCIDTVGWFDERLLGFGEEDGDYSWRFRAKIGRYPSSIALRSIANVVAPESDEYVKGKGKYSLTNSEFIALKFDLSTLAGDSIEVEPPPPQVLPDLQDYSGESFRRRHTGLLLEPDDAVIRGALGSPDTGP